MENATESKKDVKRDVPPHELLILADRAIVKIEFKDTLAKALCAKVGDLCVHSEDEIGQVATYLLRLALEEDCQVQHCFSVPGRTPEDEAIDGLLALADGLLTHSVRVLDAKMPSHKIIARSKKRLSGITSADAHHHRNYYWCGNSAKSLKAHFWTRDIRLIHLDKNQPDRWTSLIDLVAEENPAIMDVFLRWPLTAQQIAKITEKAKVATLNVLPEAPGMKQIYLPRIDDLGVVSDYLLVSPVMSIAVNASLGHAVKRFYERHRDENEKMTFRPPVASEYLLFGGTKPLNVSDYSNTVAGRHPTLSAGIPKPRMTKSLAGSVQSGSHLINLGRKANMEAASIDRPLGHPAQHRGFAKDAEAYIHEAFRVVRIYINERIALKSSGEIHFSSKMPLPKGTGGLSCLSRSLMNETKLSADQVVLFTQAFISGIQKEVFAKTTMTNDHIMLIKPLVERFLRDWRNTLGADFG
jgi:hypothetical protein